MSDHIPAFDAQQLDDHLAQQRGPLVIDFWATWCGPCVQLAPVLDALAGELAGTVAFGAVDVDAEADLAARYDIMSVPTLVLFGTNGEVVARHVGAAGAERLRAWISDHLVPAA